MGFEINISWYIQTKYFMTINSKDQYYELQKKDFLNMGLFDHPNIITCLSYGNEKPRERHLVW